MLKNKLGLKKTSQIIKIEYYIFNIKYHLINSDYTFNEPDEFSIKFLEKIHIFLFNDIYELDECKIRKTIEPKSLNFVNLKLKELKEAVENEDYETIRKNIYDIWERQIFCDGNTRTILCFLKIMKEKYNINVNYDFKEDINKDNFIRELVDSIYKEKIK